MRTALFFFITVVTLRGGAPCESEARALRLTPAKAGVRAVLEACASSLKVVGLVIQESKADIAWVFDVPLESVMSRLDAKQGGIG